MCGILGAFATSGNLPNAGELRRHLLSLSHRGPDYTGSWLSNGIFFGHTKLSIRDFTSASNQPFEYGPYVIAFNGEIYNIREIASAIGLDATSLLSDGEIIGPAFDFFGNDFWGRLDGEFAIALFDRSQRRLTLVRDRLGAKPLHYARSQDVFWFASEAKAILACRNLSVEFNVDRLCSDIVFGSWGPRDQTYFKGIECLSPGACLEICPSGERIYRYWTPEVRERASCSDDLRRSISSSVLARMDGGLQKALFLSGGVDSATIAAFAVAEPSSKPIVYSARFPMNPGYDEFDLACELAGKFGLEIRAVDVSRDDFSVPVCNQISLALEEPPVDAIFYAVWKHYAAVSRDGIRVVLTGQGNDELWCGYRKEEPLSFSVWKMRSPETIAEQFRQRNLSDSMIRLRSGISTTLEFWGGPSIHEYLSARRDVAHIDQFIRTDPSEAMGTTATRFAMATALSRHLDQEDRLGMAHGIESRVPLLSNDLIDHALRRPPHHSELAEKAVFRTAVEDRLGADAAWRPKRSYRAPQTFLLKEMTKYVADNWSEIRTGPLTGCVIDPRLSLDDTLAIFEYAPALAIRVAGLGSFADTWKRGSMPRSLQ